MSELDCMWLDCKDEYIELMDGVYWNMDNMLREREYMSEYW